MLDSDRQSQMGNARDRLSNSVRGWLEQFSSVTHLLVYVTVVVFIAQMLCEFINWPGFQNLFALNPARLRGGFVWQPVTYMFLHADVWHILFNLLVLWFFGREVEYFIGPKYFTRLYFFGGLAGAALWLAFNFNTGAYVIGASGAVLACVIAFAT